MYEGILFLRSLKLAKRKTKNDAKNKQTNKQTTHRKALGRGK